MTRKRRVNEDGNVTRSVQDYNAAVETIVTALPKLLAERRERDANAELEVPSDLWGAVEAARRRAEEAEAKLAAIKKLTQMFDGAVPTWRLREALADPPRTSAPTTGETK